MRFFFCGEDFQNHPALVSDGLHEKIHGELTLDPYLVLVVIPEELTGSSALIELARFRLPPEKVISFSFTGMHYQDWAQMAYQKALTKII